MNFKQIPFLTFLLSTLFVNTQYAMADDRIIDFEASRDAQSITILIKEDWHKLFAFQDFNQPIVNKMLYRNRPGDFTQQDKQLHIKVLYDNTSLAGFITYYLASKTIAFIELLVIDKRFRSRGYGKELIEYVAQEVATCGAKELDLYVFASNPRAIEIYQHLGFAIKHTFQGYLLMGKSIASQ